MYWSHIQTLVSNDNVAIFDLDKGNLIKGSPLAIVDITKCQILGHYDTQKGAYTELVKDRGFSDEDTIVVTGGKVIKLSFR